MKSVILALLLMASLLPWASASAQDEGKPSEPIAHTPDAVKVVQTSIKQSTYPSAPAFLVFTEYTFEDEVMAQNYYVGICQFLETEMSKISPEGMEYLPIRQDKNPKCGYARMKGTQAYTATVFENRVLQIWAFGLGINGSAGDFMTTFMHSSTDITDTATIPDPKKVDRPWEVDEANIDVTEYAQTAYEKRDND